MKFQNWVLAGLGVLAIILLAGQASIFKIAADLVAGFEGFRASPYWDVSRYSWGYGTQAPGPNGTITRAKAYSDMLAVLINDYNYLQPLIKKELSPGQWAALLSFSYNLGPGNADNLVKNINAGDQWALGEQWNKYILAGGVPNIKNLIGYLVGSIGGESNCPEIKLFFAPHGIDIPQNSLPYQGFINCVGFLCG